MFKAEYIVYLWIYINISCIRLEQHSESFKFWSAIIRINTEGKSLIMKLGPDQNLSKSTSSRQNQI